MEQQSRPSHRAWLNLRLWRLSGIAREWVTLGLSWPHVGVIFPLVFWFLLSFGSSRSVYGLHLTTPTSLEDVLCPPPLLLLHHHLLLRLLCNSTFTWHLFWDTKKRPETRYQHTLTHVRLLASLPLLQWFALMELEELPVVVFQSYSLGGKYDVSYPPDSRLRSHERLTSLRTNDVEHVFHLVSVSRRSRRSGCCRCRHRSQS